MRLVQLPIPTDSQDAILSTLDEKGVEYVVSDEISGREYAAVTYFPLPTAAVEDVLDSLEAQGVDEDTYTVVLDAETVISEKFEQLREEYEEGNGDESRISRQELAAKAEELTPTWRVFLTLTVVSAVVATAGLLLDSAAVVVGSMVIAPLIGPALGASVGSVLDDRELLVQSLIYQLGGVALAIVSAAAFAWAVMAVNVVPPGLDIGSIDEIAERLTPDLLSLVIALGAGVAGVLSISTGSSVALVGVMIAAALIPPAAAVGIAVAAGEPAAAIGSTVLVLVNVLSVNLAGLVTLWYAGYRPRQLFDFGETERRVRRHALAFGVVVLVFAVVLGAITYSSYQAATFEEDAREEVEMVLATDEYDELRLVSLEVHLDDDYPFRSPQRVAITVGGPPGGTYPDLTGALHERIDAETGESVTVELQYVDVIGG